MYWAAGLRGGESDGTLADMIRKVGQLPLHCDPGSQWNYGISTDVAGYLVEVISGQRFDHYLDDHIFTPLGMPDTGFSVPESEFERFAACYEHDPGPRHPDGRRYRLQDAPQDSHYTPPQQLPLRRRWPRHDGLGLHAVQPHAGGRWRHRW